jgi:ABC-2 type transport system permease protein
MKRYFSQAWLSFKGQQAGFSLEEFLCLEAAIPLLSLIFYCILARYSFNTDNLAHWVVGNSFLLCVSTCIFSLGNTFTAERYYGRIRSIIVSPASKLTIILQKGFFPCLVAILTVSVGFVVGSLIFGVNFSNVNLGLLFAIIIVAMFTATGFGLFIAVFGLITDQMHFVLNFISGILMLFSGANFPVSGLPFGIRSISKVIPLTRSIEATDMLFDTIDPHRLTHLLVSELGIGMCYYLLAYLIIRVVERIAIRKATLEVF